MTFTKTQVDNDISRVWPKESGNGIKVDPDAPDFAWRDIIGYIQPDTSNPTTSPTVDEFRTGIKAYEFDVNDEMHCVFHIPHDWCPCTNSFLHLHWAHNGTAITGDMTFSATVTYSSRDGSTVFPAPITTAPITVSTVDIATTPQYKHIVTEVPLSTDGGSATTLDSNDIEVDGLILVTFKCTSHPTITNGGLFVFTGDIHYQSTGIGTKNNAAPFYG